MAKGGMDKNPFGGNARLDRIDFMDFASGSDSEFKLMYIKVISDAASDYLYFGLGKNGTVADEFFYATQYFFHCRSNQPETWQHASSMRHAYVDDTTGKRVSTHLVLTNEELRQGCFDRHYEIAELHKVMPFEQFLGWLKMRRAEILEENKVQVNEYIDLLQRVGARDVLGGEQIPFKLTVIDRMQVLTSPESPQQVAELVYYSPRNRSAAAHRSGSVRDTRRLSLVRQPHHRISAPIGQTAFFLEGAAA